MIYAPIRMHPDGDEFIIWRQVSSTKSDVEFQAEKDRKILPDWCKKYPLVRIGCFEATEIREEDNG